MVEEQIADHDVAQSERRDALCQSRMASVCVGAAGVGGCLAGMGITACALGGCPGIGSYNLAAGRNVLRVSGQLPERVVKDGDPDSGDVVKVLQQGI